MNFCPLHKFRYVLGEPKKGIHKHRFLNTAVADYIMTLLSAVAISYTMNIPLVLSTITLFILGIVLHVVFGVETNTTRYLGINC
jgi:hypothetical protein|tara:strand:- start:1271 stop:1522 length:252 start_codon:yes stop_codon:yes gene_type:complete